MSNKRVSQSVALTGVLAAQAIALSYLESLIPLPAGFPPGAKPGFSNIVVMFSAGALSIPQTVAIAVFKAVFAGITSCISVAEGVTAAISKLGIDMPVVVRLEGTEFDEGCNILEKSGIDIIVATSLTDAAQKMVKALGEEK